MTDREKFDLTQMKQDLCRTYDYTCPVCGGSIFQYGTPQLAHRIAQTTTNIKKYGKSIIHNRLNLMPVCSLKCNDACNIGGRPAEVAELVGKIKKTL